MIEDVRARLRSFAQSHPTIPSDRLAVYPHKIPEAERAELVDHLRNLGAREARDPDVESQALGLPRWQPPPTRQGRTFFVVKMRDLGA